MIKVGKIFFISIFVPFRLFFLPLINPSIIVIGIIARVLVNLTVTALSRVEDPKLYILSHVDAAAVTDEVSLIAVPANMPKASPLAVENPSHEPKVGNTRAAITLKKNITEIAWATSSSLASMTGAVATMAEPPQMDEPTPINMDKLEGISNNL